MGDVWTGLRAFLTRRLDPGTVTSYAMLVGLAIALVAMGGIIVAQIGWL